MSDKATLNEVLRHVGEFLEKDVSKLDPSAKLATSIEGLTSLKMMELVLYLEECFGVEFDESAVASLDTVQDLANYIASRQPVAASGGA